MSHVQISEVSMMWDGLEIDSSSPHSERCACAPSDVAATEARWERAQRTDNALQRKLLSASWNYTSIMGYLGSGGEAPVPRNEQGVDTRVRPEHFPGYLIFWTPRHHAMPSLLTRYLNARDNS